MACEKLGLAVHHIREMSLQRCGYLPVQVLPGSAQQAAVGRFLHQHVLEGVNRIGRSAGLKYQLGSDEAGERGLQLLLAKSGDLAYQGVTEPAADHRTDLRHMAPTPNGRAAPSARLADLSGS